MSHGQGAYQSGHPSTMSHQMSPRAQSHHYPSHQMNDLAFGMKNLGMVQQHVPQQPNHGLPMQDVYHPADPNRGAAPPRNQMYSQDDFLKSMGMAFASPQQQVVQRPPMQRSPMQGSPMQGSPMQRSPMQMSPMQRSTMPQVLASAVPQNMASAVPQNAFVLPQMTSPRPHAPVQQAPPPTNLSVGAIEFVPVFRKPEKAIVLYNIENFKKKSKVDDEMAINDVKKKLVQLYTKPQDVESVMESAVETIVSWTTSINTYHQIVEDVFEFSVDEENHPNFHSIGSKVLNYMTLKVPPYSGVPLLTFFDTVIHKCCREFDNCMRLDHRHPQSQDRIKNIALIIAELFHTIKEGEMRVFIFAEQVTSLCLVLVQMIRTVLAFETVAKIFLVCGKDLKCLVDDMRFTCIMQHLQTCTSYSLDNKTRGMVENVLQLNEGGWNVREEESKTSSTSWSGGDDCQPVSNPGDWSEFATDDYDEEWLTQMLKFEEEDDFSDVEEDFKRFMEEAQKYKN